MMSALFSAVSGLKSETYDFDIIGNNIANVNTTGYKAQTVSFSDLLSQTLNSATGPTSTSGGTDATQVGLGVGIAATGTNLTVGSTESTGIDTDVSISGNGYLIVTGGSSGKYQFTREGDLSIDDNGDLTVGGNKVCGWDSYTTDSSGTSTFDTSKTVAPINLYSDSVNGNKKVIDGKATTLETLSGNIEGNSYTASGTSMTAIGTPPTSFDTSQTVEAYDSQGSSHDVTIGYKKCYSANGYTTYYWQASSSASDSSVLSTSDSGYICFNSSGQVVTTDGAGNTFSNSSVITLTPSNAGASAGNITLNFADITQTTTTDSSDTLSYTGDGYAAGTLQKYSMGQDGVITGTYSNGQTKPLGQIGLANFTNPGGLERIGSNLYAVTSNSGNFSGGVAPGSAGTGKLASGTLEMSNVDLSEQLSQMMIAQNAYEANTKTISAANTMMQSLISMVNG